MVSLCGLSQELASGVRLVQTPHTVAESNAELGDFLSTLVIPAAPWQKGSCDANKGGNGALTRGSGNTPGRLSGGGCGCEGSKSY